MGLHDTTSQEVVISTVIVARTSNLSLKCVPIISSEYNRDVTRPVFMVRNFSTSTYLPSWTIIPSRLSATVYSIYSQLPSISSQRTRYAVVTETYLSWKTPT